MIDYDSLFDMLKKDAETVAALGATESDDERTARLLQWMSENKEAGE